MKLLDVVVYVRYLLDTYIVENIVHPDAKKEPKIKIPYGRHSYGPHPKLITVGIGARRKARGSKIGNFCSISRNLTYMFVDQHRYDLLTTYPFYAFYDKWQFDFPPAYDKGVLNPEIYEPNPIIIENDVWIASNVTIKEGVTIGNGAVVAMQSVVTKNVPPYAIVGGCPARVIRYRFNQRQIDELLNIAWWNWPDDEIKKAIPLMLSDDIDKFIDYAKTKCKDSTVLNGEISKRRY